MPDKSLANLLHLSPRTISNYHEKHKSLEPVQSEHLLKLISLYDKGEDVFGSIDELNYWLNKPFWDSQEKPIDWLITPGGVDLVMLEMDRLSHGYPV
jgi:putative toxin-antitoxin system antitoxin component (TIGR02293 family)